MGVGILGGGGEGKLWVDWAVVWVLGRGSLELVAGLDMGVERGENGNRSATPCRQSEGNRWRTGCV